VGRSLLICRYKIFEVDSYVRLALTTHKMIGSLVRSIVIAEEKSV
jgi:hypothetical protein